MNDRPDGYTGLNMPSNNLGCRRYSLTHLKDIRTMRWPVKGTTYINKDTRKSVFVSSGEWMKCPEGVPVPRRGVRTTTLASTT